MHQSQGAQHHHSEMPLIEASALPLPSPSEIIYGPGRVAAYNAALADAHAASTEGAVLSTKDLSVCNQILYPPPSARGVCSCFFTTCCILSTSSTAIGCGILSLGSVIPTSAIMKAVFAPPAFFGWIISTVVSIPAMIHYRYELAPIESTSQQVLQGGPVGYLSESLLFQRHESHNQIITRETVEEGVEIDKDSRIRPPSGYVPPQMI